MKDTDLSSEAIKKIAAFVADTERKGVAGCKEEFRQFDLLLMDEQQQQQHIAFDQNNDKNRYTGWLSPSRHKTKPEC